jgi:hydrogenase maturation protein HypF
VPLPGGDATTKRPYRMAYVYTRDADLVPDLDEQERRTLDRMMERSFNTPLTSSAGRLFDAASALLSVCRTNTYEGQAPMELEGICADGEDGSYDARVEGDPFVVRASDIIGQLIEDTKAGTPAAVCAARFHNSVADVILKGCEVIREREGISTVALSGGVFANARLTERAKLLLERSRFEVLLNSTVPAGDGGVSLGQAAVAGRRLCV